MPSPSPGETSGGRPEAPGFAMRESEFPSGLERQRARRAALRRRVVILLFFVCLLGGIQTASPAFYGSAYLWAALLAASWVWARLGLVGLELQRVLRSPRSQAGAIIEERFVLRNRSRLPHFWVELWDESTLPDHQASTVLTGLGPHTSRHWVVHTLCTERGRFQLGPLTARVADPFGLFLNEKRFPQTADLVVHPYTARLPAVILSPSRLPGGTAVQRKTAAVTPSAAGVREYAPGDSLTRIHWPSTARRDRLISKEFELDPKADVWLVLDSQRDVHCRLPQAAPPESAKDVPFWARRPQFHLPPATEDYCVAAAASLADYFLHHDRSVGLAAYAQHREVIQPDRGERQRERLMERLATLRAESDLSLADALRLEGASFPRGSTVVLISPSAELEVALAAQHLRSRGIEVAVVLIERGSFGSEQSVAEVALRLRGLRVDVRLVRRDDDLSTALIGHSLAPRLTPWRPAV